MTILHKKLSRKIFDNNLISIPHSSKYFNETSTIQFNEIDISQLIN